MFDKDITEAARQVLDLCRARNLKIATAESCTGGLVAGALTEIAGSSKVVERGFMTYSDRAKQELLGVPVTTLDAHGAVSRETAEAMVKGVLAYAPVDLAVSVTGIAGPKSDDSQKPVGLVHFAVASRTGERGHVEKQFGNLKRAEIRRRSVLQALAMLKELAGKEPARG